MRDKTVRPLSATGLVFLFVFSGLFLHSPLSLADESPFLGQTRMGIQPAVAFTPSSDDNRAQPFSEIPGSSTANRRAIPTGFGTTSLASLGAEGPLEKTVWDETARDLMAGSLYNESSDPETPNETPQPLSQTRRESSKEQTILLPNVSEETAALLDPIELTQDQIDETIAFAHALIAIEKEEYDLLMNDEEKTYYRYWLPQEYEDYINQLNSIPFLYETLETSLLMFQKYLNPEYREIIEKNSFQRLLIAPELDPYTGFAIFEDRTAVVTESLFTDPPLSGSAAFDLLCLLVHEGKHLANYNDQHFLFDESDDYKIRRQNRSMDEETAYQYDLMTTLLNPNESPFRILQEYYFNSHIDDFDYNGYFSNWAMNGNDPYRAPVSYDKQNDYTIYDIKKDLGLLDLIWSARDQGESVEIAGIHPGRNELVFTIFPDAKLNQLLTLKPSVEQRVPFDIVLINYDVNETEARSVIMPVSSRDITNGNLSRALEDLQNWEPVASQFDLTLVESPDGLNAWIEMARKSPLDPLYELGALSDEQADDLEQALGRAQSVNETLIEPKLPEYFEGLAPLKEIADLVYDAVLMEDPFIKKRLWDYRFLADDVQFSSDVFENADFIYRHEKVERPEDPENLTIYTTLLKLAWNEQNLFSGHPSSELYQSLMDDELRITEKYDLYTPLTYDELFELEDYSDFFQGRKSALEYQNIADSIRSHSQIIQADIDRYLEAGGDLQYFNPGLLSQYVSGFLNYLSSDEEETEPLHARYSLIETPLSMTRTTFI